MHSNVHCEEEKCETENCSPLHCSRDDFAREEQESAIVKGCNCLFINDREGEARGQRIRSSETICNEIGAVDDIN